MIDQVSTNKTDFFREPAHFEFLNDHVLPEHQKYNSRNPINIWSSAASSGEEIYTIGMSIEEYNEQHNTKVNYSILGTDISVGILKKAVNAIYDEERIVNIPLELKRRYFLKSKNKLKRTVRINSQLRQKSKFQRLNLMDDFYDVPDNFDVVFCRNVLIYFDKKTQEKVVKKQCMKLRKDGYFFLGHSESIIGLDLPLKQIKPTIYKKI
jgi:chemotaxis protein methyltransferase CheR